jgi:hypothetical protein
MHYEANLRRKKKIAYRDVSEIPHYGILNLHKAKFNEAAN